MTSLLYEDICSRFFPKVRAYDFLDLSETQLSEVLADFIQTAVSNPYVRRLFTSLNNDRDSEEITYELKYEVEESYDSDFVAEILALGMVIAWLQPIVNDVTNLSYFVGSSAEKFYAQSPHINTLSNLYESTKRNQRGMIRDRGYANNTYLDV